MVELFRDGFETGDFSAWDGLFITAPGSITIDEAINAACGRFNARSQVGGFLPNYAACYKDFVPNLTEVYARWYVYIVTLPPTTTHLDTCSFLNAAAQEAQTACIWNRAGVYSFEIYNRVDVTYYGGNIMILANKWYCCEMRVLVHDTDGIIQAWFDHVQVTLQTGLDTRRLGSDIRYVLFGRMIDALTRNISHVDACVISEDRVSCNGVFLDGKFVEVWHDGFEESRDLVRSEVKDWEATLAKVTRNIHPFGSVRTWRLHCFEWEVDWANSVVKAFQDLVDDNSTVTFTVETCHNLHFVGTTVKVLGVKLLYPSGSNIGTRERDYILELQEVIE